MHSIRFYCQHNDASIVSSTSSPFHCVSVVCLSSDAEWPGRQDGSSCSTFLRAKVNPVLFAVNTGRCLSDYQIYFKSMSLICAGES